MLTRSRIYLLTITLILQLIVNAQENINASFTTASGLPDNNVTCMLTDKQGFIWLGTSNGLCRFDGTHFFTVPKGVLQSNKLAGDIILDLEEDGDHIWAAHRFGLSRINKYSFECTNFQNNDTGARYVHLRSIRDIYKDSFGNIWLAGDHQLLQFNRKTNTIVTIADLEKILPGRRNRQVSKIIPNGQNELMLLLVRSWVKYNIPKNTVDTQAINSIPVKLLRGENVRIRSYWNTFLLLPYLSFDKEKQTIAISSDSSANDIGRATNFYVDSNLKILVSQEKNSLTNPPVSKQVDGYSYDQGGTQPFNFIQFYNDIPCWGSSKGLHIANGHLKYARRYALKNNTKDPFPFVPDILDVNEYSDSEWLVATKSGLYLMDRSTTNSAAFTRWNDSTIYKIKVQPDKTVWLSTNKSLWHFDPKTGLTKKRIPLHSYAISIIQLHDNLMVTTRSDGVMLVNQNTLQATEIKSTDSNKLISSNRITAIKKLPGSEQFIMTYNDLPGRYSYNNFEKISYRSESIPLSSYALGEGFSIESVLPATKQLWFGSYLGGVHVYDSIAHSWTNFTVKEGLGNNTVFEIIQDKQNRIWLLTDNGIDVYDNRSRKIYNLPLKLVTGGKKGGFINGSGNLIVYDNKSIFEINLAAFDLDTQNKHILLAQVFQGGKQLSLQRSSLDLPYNNNSFSINFSLQKFDPLIETKYAYRLSATDNWKEIGTQTQLNFASLEPGSYILQIKATDEFGQWKNYSTPFPIKINPPFWKTWWFFILAFLSFIIAGWYVITVRQKRKLKALSQQNEITRLQTTQELIVAKERERITADLHDEVGANLSSIRILADLITNVTQPDPALFAGKISNIARSTSQQMNTIIWALNSDNDSMLNFCEYVRQYAVQFLEGSDIKLEYRQDLENEQYNLTGDVRKNLFLSVKEVLHNAVKYSKCTLITINIEQSGNQLSISIADNGTGIIQQNQFGNGIRNIQNRLTQLSGTVSFENESGLKVTFHCLI